MKEFSLKLLTWFDAHGRKDLPWQIKPANAYHVWVSEIMLQQTQVTTVINYFNNFIQHFPNLESLANADEDVVLAQFSGLGYYARARNLHKTAKIILQNYQGVFPTTLKQVMALPGIGESTAGAILSISYNQNHAILDGNVKRVLSRYHEIDGHYGQSSTIKQLWKLARLHTPKTRNDDYTQAIMDLGATVCTRNRPKCNLCPVRGNCQAKQHNTQNIYPVAKPKKDKPTKSVAMLIFRNKNKHIYLQKRPKDGIWGGLWSFVECKNNDLSISKTIKKFQSMAVIEHTLPMIKHSFTHYHLNISPIVIFCPETQESFYSTEQLNLGLPTPVSKIIAQLD